MNCWLFKNVVQLYKNVKKENGIQEFLLLYHATADIQ